MIQTTLNGNLELAKDRIIQTLEETSKQQDEIIQLQNEKINDLKKIITKQGALIAEFKRKFIEID